MHVLFDARLLHRPLSGLERVQRNLLRELAAREEITRLRVLVVKGGTIHDVFPARVELIPVADSEDVLRILLDERPGARPDVFHMTFFPDRSPRDLLLPSAAAASVVSVTDAILNRHPEYHADAESFSWYHRFVCALTASADRILSYTESAGREAVFDLGVDGALVDVTPLAIDPSLTRVLSAAEAADRRQRHSIDGVYFAAVGKDYPHKDYPTMFRALARLDPSVRIVVAGSRVWTRPYPDGQTLDQLLDRLGLRARVRWIPGLDDEDVKAVLQGSSGLLYPSLEEGFGLPPLEAMTIGVPAVVAPSTSIPEVCDDGVLYFKPGDDAALADHMQTLLAGGAEVDALVRRGRERATHFTWRRCADGTLDCYRKAIAGVAAPQRKKPALRDLLRVVAACPFKEASDLLAWQERCRAAEQHGWAVEDHRDEVVHRLHALEDQLLHVQQHARNVERHRDEICERLAQMEARLVEAFGPAAAGAPVPGGSSSFTGPRWSVRRRLGKIKRALDPRGSGPAGSGRTSTR